MDSLDPDLDLLRDELERLDYVVVHHGEHICVRLPLLSSVVIRHSEGRFRFVPQFGPLRRSGGLLFTSGVSAAAVAGAALAFGAAPLTLLVAFLGDGGSGPRCLPIRSHRRLPDTTSAAHSVLGGAELAKQSAGFGTSA